MMNMEFKRKLTIPADLKKEYPVTEEMRKRFLQRDEALKKILSGEDDRIVLVIGPCSADQEASVMDYVNRLRALQEKVADRILMIPRVYTNKPRTTGAGYKGMLHQPNPDAAPDMLKGLIAIRELHMRVLRETEFSAADEMLYPENYKYLDDLLAYVAVGARSVEDQQHRLTSSGISVPVGMKNPTGGDISVMMNSINAAQHSHTFIYRGWEATSKGNPYAHAILRGYTNKHGNARPNYHYEDLIFLHECYEKNGRIYGETQRLISLVEDIINLSRLDEGTGYQWSNANLLEIAREVAVSLESCAADKQVKLTVEGVPVQLRGVPELLRGIAYNLCDNAIKYNKPGGSVTVSVNRENDKAVLTVKDTGIGIPEGEQDRIFERFYRVDKSHSKEVGGTGLGLSIVKHAAMLHKAGIDVSSRPGTGTTIQVTFPIE